MPDVCFSRMCVTYTHTEGGNVLPTNERSRIGPPAPRGRYGKLRKKILPWKLTFARSTKVLAWSLSFLCSILTLRSLVEAAQGQRKERDEGDGEQEEEDRWTGSGFQERRQVSGWEDSREEEQQHIAFNQADGVWINTVCVAACMQRMERNTSSYPYAYTYMTLYMHIFVSEHGHRSFQ